MKVSLKWLSEYVDVPCGHEGVLRPARFDGHGRGGRGADGRGARRRGGRARGDVRAASRQRPHARGHGGRGRGRAGADRVRRAEHRGRHASVPVATVGAVLPGDFKIKKSKLRGVASCGMCCSRRELGMGADHEGIWILPEDAPVGAPIADYAEALRHGARPGDHAEPSRLPLRRGLRARGGRHVPARLARTRWPRWRPSCSSLPTATPVDAAVSVTIEDPTALPALHRARHPRLQGGAEPRLDGRAAGRHRPALHQQHRGRDQLRPVPARPAAARLRPGHARNERGACAMSSSARRKTARS